MTTSADTNANKTPPLDEEGQFSGDLKLEDPYFVPEGYFDELQKNLMERIRSENEQSLRFRRASRSIALYAAAAVVLLATVSAVLFYTLRPTAFQDAASIQITLDDLEAASLIDEFNESSIIDEVVASTDPSVLTEEASGIDGSMLEEVSPADIIQYLLETNNIESLTYEL